MVPGMLRGEPTWKELRAHGVGWWVKSGDTLKRLIEKVCALQIGHELLQRIETICHDITTILHDE